MTNQRLAILEYLKGNHTHPTVEQVYEGVKARLPRISKATVYQNLKYLSETGLVKEMDVRGVSRFDSVVEPHHHIICSGCGRIIDFESKQLTNYALRIAKKLKNVEVVDAVTHFYGLCDKCNEEDKNG